jgi:predicted phage terminase large subunit-like protein
MGHAESFRCGGVMGSPVGHGANLILVDDPYKSRQDAQSRTVRRRVLDWFTGDVMHRLDGDGSIVLMAHRHHPEDLTGEMLRADLEDETGEGWEYIAIPSRLDEGLDTHPDDPRAPGAGMPLWPWLWAGKKDGLSQDEEMELARKRLLKLEAANRLAFGALFQQNPRARSGGVFKVDKIQVMAQRPGPIAKSIRYWDKAGTEGGGKRTAGVRQDLLKDGRIWVEDVVKGQWSALNREKRIKDTAIIDTNAVEVWVEKEGGSGGKESAEATVRNLGGFVVHLDRPTGSKLVRAEPYSSQVEGGNVILKEAPWNREYIEELRDFTGEDDDFSDQVDASSGAYNKLQVQLPGFW